MERAEALVRGALDDLPEDPQFALHRIFCLLRGSQVARNSGDGPAGIERALQAQRLLRESPAASAVLGLRVSMDLAESCRVAGRNREAAAGFEEAFAQLAALGREETETAGTLLNNWGLTLGQAGRPLEAEPLFRRAIRISSADPAGRGVSPMLFNNLGWTLFDLHRLAEAARLAERAYVEAQRAGTRVVVYQSLLLRARVYREAGDLARASGALSEVEPLLKRMVPAGHSAFSSLAAQQALLAQARGDLDAAAVAADRAVAIAEASTQSPHGLRRLLMDRSDLALLRGRLEAAEADAARALRLEQKATEPGARSSRLGQAYLTLGRALQARGKGTEARSCFASALEQLEPTVGEDHPDSRQARRLAAAGAQSP
jgi:tetratricopeptide (TPR) repeat protein